MDLAISPLWRYGNRVKLSVTHANRVHVGVKRAALMMKSRRINTRPILCEGFFLIASFFDNRIERNERRRKEIVVQLDSKEFLLQSE